MSACSLQEVFEATRTRVKDHRLNVTVAKQRTPGVVEDFLDGLDLLGRTIPHLVGGFGHGDLGAQPAIPMALEHIDPYQRKQFRDFLRNLSGMQEGDPCRLRQLSPSPIRIGSAFQEIPVQE